MNDIQIFQNPEFGEIRTIEQDGEPWFVGKALGGKSAPAYNDPHVRGKLFSECNRDIQDWFRVNSVCNVPRKDFAQAVEYIQRWKPSTNSVMLIQQTNAQTSLYE